MNPKIVFSYLECTNCGECIKACERVHGESRIKKEGNSLIFCNQCDDAPCAIICGVKAVEKEGNIPVLNGESCVGCNLCIEVCPTKAVHLKGLCAHKCNLCLDSDNLIPACVEACKDNALKILE
ncbi:MAG: 4Fe-4S dicluster domain-containing protein [Methanomicrobiales archaeon]